MKPKGHVLDEDTTDAFLDADDIVYAGGAARDVLLRQGINPDADVWGQVNRQREAKGLPPIPDIPPVTPD